MLAVSTQSFASASHPMGAACPRFSEVWLSRIRRAPQDPWFRFRCEAQLPGSPVTATVA